ncbi:uncharacterized protein G2W53_015160 [Senna tora]|uniref:Uncharacterized protein n=1 Tax=Senna tora TaxID=362788 RepID=A0A834WUZ0_9FABA|nr:uncharacterized protein G2W53_015160 [Senna tora]
MQQISRCRRLIAVDLAEENAEVLRETEGEEASAAAEEEVFGLEIGDMLEELWLQSHNFEVEILLWNVENQQ